MMNIQILEFIAGHGEITEEDTQMILNVKDTRAYVILKQLTDAGIIKKNRPGKGQKIYLQRTKF